MADSTKIRGAGDRSRVSGNQAYEVSYFARKHGISIKQAKDLIHQIGNDRNKLNQAAQALKA